MIAGIPKISVLMPVYNGSIYLKEAIESVLKQTFIDFELLILNDGSTDNSVDIINSYNDERIKLINNNKNVGLISTLNNGMILSKGEYIIRQDQDDISLPDRFEKQINFMETHKDIVLCGSWIKTFGGAKSQILKVPVESDYIKCQMLFYSVIYHPSIILKKKLFIDNNYFFDKSFIHADDYELWTRVLENHKFANIPEVLLLYRMHQTNTSKIYNETQISNSDITRKNQLKKLGIIPSDDEFNMHKLICFEKPVSNPEKIKRIELWMNKLLDENKKTNIYSQQVFEKVLGEKWFKVCDLTNFKILKMFFSSNLKNFFRLSKLKIIFIFIRLFLHQIKNKLIFLIKIPFRIINKIKYLSTKLILLISKKFKLNYYNKNLIGRLKYYEINKKKPEGILKNILHINSYDNIGGAALLSNSLCSKLIGFGYDSRMLVSKKTGNYKYVEVLKKKSTIKQNFYNLLQKIEKWDDFFEFGSLSLKEYEIFKQADIIHLHNIHGGYFNPFILPEITSIKPVIWTLHDTSGLKYPCDEYCNNWENNCTNCSKHNKDYFNESSFFVWKNQKEIIEKSNFTLVCPSNWLKNEALKSYYKNKDIRCIYNGIDTNIFKTYDKKIVREKLNLPIDKIILLFIAHGGINNPSKGGDYIKQVYQEFKKNDNIFFVCIGGNETKFNDNNWKEISYIADKNILALYYSAADLFIYPSINDIFGLVVAESISCGTPVITFNTGGIPEIVEHNKTGFVTNYKDTGGFINGIKMFIENQKLRHHVSLIGNKIIKEKFSLDEMTENYIDLYKEIFEKFYKY